MKKGSPLLHVGKPVWVSGPRSESCILWGILRRAACASSTAPLASQARA